MPEIIRGEGHSPLARIDRGRACIHETETEMEIAIGIGIGIGIGIKKRNAESFDTDPDSDPDLDRDVPPLRIPTDMRAWGYPLFLAHRPRRDGVRQ